MPFPFLRRVGTGAMRARLESPRTCYATPSLRTGTTRASRRRQLPTNDGHAARPLGATRAYQRDSSSKPPHRPRCADALRTSAKPGGPGPPKKSLDGRSFHISRAGQRELEPGYARGRRTPAAIGRMKQAEEIGRDPNSPTGRNAVRTRRWVDCLLWSRLAVCALRSIF
jgi:hypothetical protein